MATRRTSVHVKAVSGTLNYSCQYYDQKTRKTVTMLETGLVTEEPVTKGVMVINFTSAFPKLDYVWNTELRDDDDIAKQVGFWRRCPLVQIYGGKNENIHGEGLLLLIDETEVKDYKTSLIKKQGEVSDKIRRIGAQGRYNVAMYYGIPNLGQKTDDDIIVDLIDWHNGLLMNPKNTFAATGGPYMDHYLEFYDDKAANTMIAINVKRAIAAELIKVIKDPQRPEFVTYQYMNANIGINEDQVIAYFTRNMDEYEKSLVTALQHMDAQKQAAKKIGKEKKSEQISEAKLRNMGKDLGIASYWNKNVAQLAKEVDEALEKQKQSEGGQIASGANPSGLEGDTGKTDAPVE